MVDCINVMGLQAGLRREWPEMAARVYWAVPNLYWVRDRLYDDLCRRLGSLDLLPAEVDILLALRVQPTPRELTPTVLYQSLLLSSGGMSKILGRLERDGLVVRPPNPMDGRSRLVRLTEKGDELLAQAMEIVLDHEQALLGVLTPEEEGVLTRLLDKLGAAMERSFG